MAETYVWSEGSALFWTGASTTSATAAYAQNITHGRQIIYTSYKPPHSTTYTNYPYQSAATLSIGQLYSQLQLVTFFEAATGGGIHCHIKKLAPNINQSAGVFYYSGVIQSIVENGQEGGLFNNGLTMRFPSWTAY